MEELPHQLNAFLARFERHAFSADLLEVKESLLSERNVEIKEEVVNRLLKGISVNKCSGPDGTDGRTLKFYADQLSGVLVYTLCTLFLENVQYYFCPDKACSKTT